MKAVSTSNRHKKIANNAHKHLRKNETRIYKFYLEF